MKKDKRGYVLMLLVSTLLGAAGQILFKLGVTSSLAGLVLFILLGVVAYLVSTVLYFYVLVRTHLSWAYSFAGLSYVFASLIAYFFLAEPVPQLRWVGIFIIAVGTALIGAS